MHIPLFSLDIFSLRAFVPQQSSGPMDNTGAPSSGDSAPDAGIQGVSVEGFSLDVLNSDLPDGVCSHVPDAIGGLNTRQEDYSPYPAGYTEAPDLYGDDDPDPRDSEPNPCPGCGRHGWHLPPGAVCTACLLDDCAAAAGVL